MSKAYREPFELKFGFNKWNLREDLCSCGHCGDDNSPIYEPINSVWDVDGLCLSCLYKSYEREI
jgi:hypothetical protein